MAVEVTFVIRFEDDLDETDVARIATDLEDDWQCVVVETAVEEC